jgi:hypothetical protein
MTIVLLLALLVLLVLWFTTRTGVKDSFEDLVPVVKYEVEEDPFLRPMGGGRYAARTVRQFETDPLMYNPGGLYYSDLEWGWPLYSSTWIGGGYYGGPYNRRWEGGAAAYPWTTNVDGVQRNKLMQ